jgi:hypothetical protein
MKLSLRKETLAELSPDELVLIGAGNQEPTPPYYSVDVLCIVRRLTVLCQQPTPPISQHCVE